MDTVKTFLPDVDSFLRDLSELTYRYGLVIGERGEVYRAEQEDYESRYFLNKMDYLQFDTTEVEYKGLSLDQAADQGEVLLQRSS